MFGLGRLALTWPVAMASSVIFIVCAIIGIIAIVDAFLSARRIGAVVLARHQRVCCYVGVWLLVTVITNLNLATLWTANCPTVGSCRPGFVYSIPSKSMEPTLMVGDFMFTDPRYFLHHEPQRGDIAVFRYPRIPTVDSVKRIVGLPGDRIALRAGRLLINGMPVELRRVEDFDLPDEQGPAYGRARPSHLEQYVETLPDGRSCRIVLRDKDGSIENTPEITVPPEHYFVLGDNRDDSANSRISSAIGFVPHANLIARPKFLYWSRSWGKIGATVD